MKLSSCWTNLLFSSFNLFQKQSISDVTKAGHCRLAAVDGSLEACPTDCAPGPQSFPLFLFLDFTEYLGVPVSGSTVSNYVECTQHLGLSSTYSATSSNITLQV